ncbi:hypothetical protein [Flavobacterium capsici]|uniref:Uncharacterized protein n=1 Tax=Flavobacterium capsici TaxID=3075618 RepID=A0AA96F279_9FLAO|nr:MULTISPECIES: hypothetical protein [unclassified Flavobacterium]WNM18617.1 hypothetical protein RN608_11425 [Flavobacterium sp. PMR2A8]WNM22668.1 hypothetical protein RN605_04725 [Flavobacterium sp. PMTSA4]
MNEQNDKNKVGRPFKMEKWIPALKSVLEERNIVFLTDTDLVFLVNKKLPIEDRITTRCFKNWKAGKFAPNEELGEQFIELVQEALINEKEALLNSLKNEKSGYWVRYAWILERKFEEYNLKQVTENINKNEETQIIQITAANLEQKKMIENLINVDFEEVKPKQIKIKPEVESTDNKEEDYGF